MTVQYLIDSENVGDFWIPLLELPAEQTELIVFYTRNSPHMSYESLIRLKESDRKVTFIKCYEGTNALDFQLVSELGYRICQFEGCRFVIVTNDTGFDAAVKYWRRSRKSVKRITGKECRNLERRKKEDLAERGSAEPERASAHPSAQMETEEKDSVSALASADSISADEAGNQDARSSRPVLRDAESAASPEPEENDFPVDSYEGRQLDFVSGDLFELEDLEEAAESDRDAGFAEDSEAEDFLYEEEGRDWSEEESQAVFHEEGAKDSPDEEAQAALHEERAQDSPDAEEQAVFHEEGAKDVSEEEQAAFHEEGAQNSPDEEEQAAFHEEGAQDSPGEEASLILSGQDIPFEDREEDSLGEEHEEARESEPGEDMSSSGSDFHGDRAGQEPALEELSDSSASAQEDRPADEAAHSRSRRSRSRRTRSSSKKQDHMEDRPESVPGEESTALHGPREGAQGRADAGDQDAPLLGAPDNSSLPGDEEIARIVACIGADNLAELHNQLATFYGDQGKEIYLSIKNNSRSLPVMKPDLKQKFEYYCEIIFARSDYSGDFPSDISDYLLNVREKLNNLNSLRYALQKHYGKEKGRRFYFLLKPFAKTMYQM